VNASNSKNHPIRFGREICGDLTQAERREWWLSNGLSGYAAGTIAETLTRRYHGLLVAPLYPPLGRVLLLAKVDATLTIDGRDWPLFTNRWAGGAIEPAGFAHLESFHLDGRLPVWRYRIGDIVVEKRIWLEQGKNCTRIAWRCLSNPRHRSLSLRVALLINARDHHAVSGAEHIHPAIGADQSRLSIVYEDGNILHLCAEGGEMICDPVWIEHFDLPLERQRGLEDRDAHLRAGYALFEFNGKNYCGVTASVNERIETPLALSLQRMQAHEQALISRAEKYVPTFHGAPDWIRQLVLAADSFLFARPLRGLPDGQSVIAGYPWFGDWGRDTMIALPGLTLATGRYDSARRILQTFARFVDHGMLPNLFPEAGEKPDYNTVDAALWYIEAWRAYVDSSGDNDALHDVFPVLESMIAAHLNGMCYGIVVDAEDGLLRAGESGVQLTWMDAKVGDWVVTPRIGKPVEINALWYNALCIMADFATAMGGDADASPYQTLAIHAASSFNKFIRSDGMGLLDVIDGPNDSNSSDRSGGPDDSIRPNQILAVSLPHSPLDRETQQQVVSICGRELLTSYGMRSLAPGQAGYQGHYGGGVLQRDGGYHQGTVWGWLSGHYALAEYRVTDDVALALSRLQPMADHLNDAALGTISEIFDGDPPHTPRGAPAQAWSVACTLEAWWRLSKQADKSGKTSVR